MYPVRWSKAGDESATRRMCKVHGQFVDDWVVASRPAGKLKCHHCTYCRFSPRRADLPREKIGSIIIATRAPTSLVIAAYVVKIKHIVLCLIEALFIFSF